MTLAAALTTLPKGLPAAIVRDGDRVVLAAGIEECRSVHPSSDSDPFAILDAIDRGWWAGYVGYDLGRRIEQVHPRPAPDAPPGTPAPVVADLAFARFATRAEIAADGSRTLFGTGPERRALERALDATPPIPTSARPVVSATATWASSLDRWEFESRVRAIQELIRRGECYQVNLTRQLRGPAVDPVALWTAVALGNPAPHAMFWRGPGGVAIVGASPERFLRIDDRTVETRPIKGTAARAIGLRTSDKDRAENVMIVDLARNDLGRVCRPGSVEVPRLCEIEAHPGLVHLVSTVRGVLRDDVGLGGLLRASFPPASITGAPKPRVMQAIEELEPVPRGIYCGATGWFDADRRCGEFAVTIRTFICTEAETTLGVGAGITIDSDPATEWAETELKAARLLEVAGTATTNPLAAARS